MQESELETVRAAARGERDALSALFRAHWDGVHRVARGLTGSASLADDIAQDAFERAFRGLRSFDGRSSFRTWIQRIAVNRALDEVRRRRPTLPLEVAAEVGHDGPAPPDAQLRAAVWALHPDRRAVVVLRFWLDYTLPEIAEVLDVREGTVHSRLSRALGDLRTAMEVPA